MRIVHVCRTAPPAVGGLEGVVGELTRRLAARGHDVTLATFVPGATDGVRRVVLGPVGWGWSRLARGLSAALQQADVIHVHGVELLLDQVLWRRTAPVGVSTHGGYFHTPRFALAKALWSRTGTVATLRAVDGLWWTSEADRRRYPWAPDGVVEPPGVDVERFTARDPAPEAGVVVVPGRLDVHKGLLDLLPAVALLGARVTRVELVGPVAAPALPGRLQARAAALGVPLVLRGPLSGDDYARALSTAALVWLPSRAEGFGVAAVEALAAGARTVLSDIPAHRAHAGVAPLAPMADPAAAAAVAAATLDAPWDVARARAHAARWSWDTRVTAFEDRYRALLQA